MVLRRCHSGLKWSCVLAMVMAGCTVPRVIHGRRDAKLCVRSVCAVPVTCLCGFKAKASKGEVLGLVKEMNIMRVGD